MKSISDQLGALMVDSALLEDTSVRKTIQEEICACMVVMANLHTDMRHIKDNIAEQFTKENDISRGAYKHPYRDAKEDLYIADDGTIHKTDDDEPINDKRTTT